MKTFEQLTFEQKTGAIRFAEYQIVENVANGVLDLELVDADAQDLLESVLSKSRKTEQPRLVKLFLLGEKSIRKEIYKLAIVAASGGTYDKNGNPHLGRTTK
jgi:tetrahydromethanopterin S-methyltransferase subunit H